MDQQQRFAQVLALFATALEQPETKRRAFVEAQFDALGFDREQQDQLLGMLAGHASPGLELETDLVGPARPPVDSIGAYRVLRLIARGGMGEVLLAERADGNFERQVAIKMLRRRALGPAWEDRFQREQQIHGRLQHPNIARLLDAGLTDDRLPYLVMDYVEGQSILDYAKTQRCTLSQRVELLVQVSEAVAFAHNRLVLHRDLKPSNVLVTQAGQVKLLDFGIAKLLDEGEGGALTRTGERLMTPRYASPEQIRGEELAVTSDVYSLGVMLYELLTEQVPFVADSDYKLGEQILKQQPKDPTDGGPTLGGKIPADLRAICLKSLEKEPADRYATAAALADDLRRFLNHETVSARRPDWLQRARRFWLRHPVAVPISALTVLAISGAAAIAFWQAEQARSERDRAEQVTEVLVDLFDSDPFAETEERRDDLTLREFLTRRADSLEQELPDDPDLQATLFQLFGDLLANLNLLDDAEGYAEQALALRRELHQGGPNEALAESLNTMGKVRLRQGRFAESGPLFRESLAMREDLYPENHPLVAQAINDLSVALSYWGDEHLDESLVLDRRALAINIEQFGDRSSQAAQGYNNLATSLLYRDQPGDKAEAADLFRRALDIRIEQLGQDHANTLTTKSNLANTLHDLQRFEPAEALFREAIAGLRTTMGEDHSRVADAFYGYAHLLVDLERLDDAEDAFAASIAIYQSAYPADHPYIAETALALGKVQLDRGKETAALDNFRLAESILSQRDDAAADWYDARYHSARALLAMSQTTEAHRVASELLSALSEQEGYAALTEAVKALLDPVR